MKRTFAVPTLNGKCCAHFGQCHSFALVEVEDGVADEVRYLDPPNHQPGSFPRFLAEQGVDVVLAGGMGLMAQNLFRENNIEVHMGIGIDDPGLLVEKFLLDQLPEGENLCNHGTGDHEPVCGD